MTKNYSKVLLLGLGFLSVVLFQNCAGSGEANQAPEMIACSLALSMPLAADIHIQFSQLHGKLLVKQNGNVIFNECQLTSAEADNWTYTISTNVVSDVNSSSLPNTLDIQINDFSGINTYDVVSNFTVSDLGATCPVSSLEVGAVFIDANNIVSHEFVLQPASSCTPEVLSPEFDLSE